MKEIAILTTGMLLFAYASKADGIAAFLAPPDPCWENIFAIHEEDEVAQQIRVDNLCGAIPSIEVALNQNYTPGHPDFYWDQPDPLPSPVPLPAAGWLMLAGLAMLAVRRMK